MNKQPIRSTQNLVILSKSLCSTYLTNDLIFGADDSSNVVSQAIVADVFTLKEILCDDLADFFFGFASKAVSLYIELDDSLV